MSVYYIHRTPPTRFGHICGQNVYEVYSVQNLC